MSGSVFKNSIRIAAGIMGFMMLVIVLFSSLFIAIESCHDCEGEDCHVCECIRQCENILHETGKTAANTGMVILPVPMILLSVFAAVCVVIQGTPVSRKVRLNN